MVLLNFMKTKLSKVNYLTQGSKIDQAFRLAD